MEREKTLGKLTILKLQDHNRNAYIELRFVIRSLVYNDNFSKLTYICVKFLRINRFLMTLIHQCFSSSIHEVFKT